MGKFRLLHSFNEIVNAVIVGLIVAHIVVEARAVKDVIDLTDGVSINVSFV